MDAGLVVYALYLAAIYGLMAIGISLLWSSVGMVNMAHGATFAIAGYAAYFAAVWGQAAGQGSARDDRLGHSGARGLHRSGRACSPARCSASSSI